MVLTLTFDECVKDSPTFREMLHHAESDTSTLEGILEKVLKQATNMNEVGKQYNTSSLLLAEALKDTSEYFKQDPFVKNVLNQFIHVLTEISSFHMILDQAQRSINTQMTHFLKAEVKGNQDMKKIFDKVSNDYDNALSKHASASRFKPHEIDDAEASLANHKSNFRKVSMEYVFQMNMLHKNKRIHVVDKISSYMHALHTFFHQGFELFKDMEPFLKKTGNLLSDVTRDIDAEKNDMKIQQQRYQSMAGDNSMFVKQVDSSPTNIIEGYLFKRASNAFKTWSRRWFSVHNNKLFYQSKLKSSGQEDKMVVVDDLRLCNIRITDEVERRFCFEVISPTKSFLLQAESEDVRLAWVNSIQSCIQEAYKLSTESSEVMTTQSTEMALSSPQPSNGVKASKSSPTISQSSTASERRSSKSSNKNSPGSTSSENAGGDKKTPLQKIMEIPGNTSCADCKKHEARWASVNLGVVLCIECSGVHRSLGVHISKVRSLTLDSWEPEVTAIMQSLGNDRVNEIYEARLQSPRIRPGCSNKDRLDFVQAKYVRREFCAILPSIINDELEPNKKLRRWKIRKSKPKRRRERKKADSFLDEDGNERIDDQAAEDSAEKPVQPPESDVFVFGVSKVPDPEGETEVENSDIEEMQTLDADLLFYKAANLGNIPVMLLAKANGADINWHNPKEKNRTPLIQAATVGSIRACEYLLINGAKINNVDIDGRSPLHYAAIYNNTGIACQFLKRKALHNVTDKNDKTPLQIAIDAANADIVTLIRLKQMNDEMNDTDPGSTQTDSLVTDVFRDFSHRAATNDLPSPDEARSPLFSPFSPKLRTKDSAAKEPSNPNKNNNNSVEEDTNIVNHDPIDLSTLESTV